MAEITKLGTLQTQPLEEEFGKLKTDEIIVTNERLDHIQKHHPQDYALFMQYGISTVLVKLRNKNKPLYKKE